LGGVGVEHGAQAAENRVDAGQDHGGERADPERPPNLAEEGELQRFSRNSGMVKTLAR